MPSLPTAAVSRIFLSLTLFLGLALTSVAQADLLAYHPAPSIVAEADAPAVTMLEAPNVRFFPKLIQHEGWMHFDNPGSEPHYLELLNTDGNCVWQGRDGGSGSIQLKVAHLPAGSYSWILTSIGGTTYEGELTLR